MPSSNFAASPPLFPNRLNKSGKINFLSHLTLVIVMGILVFYLAEFALLQKSEETLDKEINELAQSLDRVAFLEARKAASLLSKENIVLETINSKLPIDNPLILSTFNSIKKFVNASIIYALNAKGKAVACTPYGKNMEKTLTGNNYSFREYFNKAMSGESLVVYAALGVTTGERGIYFCAPIKKDLYHPHRNSSNKNASYNSGQGSPAHFIFPVL